MKVITDNRKARHDYYIEDSVEAGIVLKGTEVKSIRAGHVTLKDAYASISNGEIFIEGMHISPYEHGNIFNVDPLRKRKLLLHKRQILRLAQKTQEKGLTLVPLKLYFDHDKVKVDLALAKGKKLYDKRAVAAEKSARRDIDRALKSRQRS
ncbi:MAG: SsrA-binding protein SmpB [Clostridia bacterium]|uniref:SsrA-binding protein n=1 Tax=Peptococcus niger TaxID=2741 RepID=A0A1G6ZHR9_PEPNI|nr:SsrA-binding protein SmpB [Peptococcus niger]MDU1028364.1 SsrA-binding protein SmpB [Clostridiales bacterium]MDU7245582.1 SsrA-binding protein SmpB [Clostridiales bacterium]MDU7506108.1 SsrA-binding protein SmpB [Clostridia bacterium]SDE01146.1 SsrA-binding protein [Peptococcus niger]